MLTFQIRPQLQFCHLPLQEGVHTWQVFRPDVRQQNSIHSVKVTDQFPETSLRVRATVHQHREAIHSKECTVTTASGKHVAARSGQFEEAHGGGRRQEVKGRWRGEGSRDQGGKLPQGLHCRQHLWGIDVKYKRALTTPVPGQSRPPLTNVRAAEGQVELRGGGGGGGAFLIYELRSKQ